MNYLQQDIRNYAIRGSRQFKIGMGIYASAMMSTTTITTITP